MELGDRWPLSVDRGHVDCDQGTSFAMTVPTTHWIWLPLEKGIRASNQSGRTRLAHRGITTHWRWTWRHWWIWPDSSEV